MTHLTTRLIAAAAAALLTTGAAHAAITMSDRIIGNDCNSAGGIPATGFSNCWASPTSTTQSVNMPTATGPWTPSIYKYDNGGATEASTRFPTITGAEFSVTFTNNVLSWTYTPGDDDPEIHAFTIKQARGFRIFSDFSAPITSFSIDLGQLDWDSYSHVTWFDTGSLVQVPVPATLGLLGLGVTLLGATSRRRRG